MKNEVITLSNPSGVFTDAGISPILTYLRMKETKTGTYGIQHRLRVKEAIYGQRFSNYNDEMDFTNAITAGCIIIRDKRNER